MKSVLMSSVALVSLLVAANGATAFEAEPQHERFVEAFNSRDWSTVQALLADDVVFHRANAPDVFVAPEPVVAHWSSLIGAPDQWNVKFVELDTGGSFVGKDGRVVERGDFAITAGANDDSCYRGSYLMTWVPVATDDWRLQMMTWQDVEADLADCT